MSNLYKDAIADARKLREAAEANAKNRIVEAITPKLRRLIEKQINEGDDELVDDLETDELIDAEETLDGFDDEESYEVPEAEPMVSRRARKRWSGKVYENGSQISRRAVVSHLES